VNAPVNDFPRTALYRTYIYKHGMLLGWRWWLRLLRAWYKGGKAKGCRYAVAAAAAKKAELNLLRHNFFDTATAGTNVLRRVFSPRPYAHAAVISIAHLRLRAAPRSCYLSINGYILEVCTYHRDAYRYINTSTI